MAPDEVLGQKSSGFTICHGSVNGSNLERHLLNLSQFREEVLLRYLYFLEPEESLVVANI